MEYRIKQVAEKVARGYTRKEVISWITVESGWDIGESQAHIYHQRAWDLIRELGAVTKQGALGKALFDLEYLYKKALEKGDLDLGLKVRKEISDTLGIKKQTIKLEGPGDAGEELSVADALLQQAVLRRESQAMEIRSQQARDRENRKNERRVEHDEQDSV